ncbi:hypothetical protein [Paractinoplanes ferrugineus]|uniref:hypothetical protein n=1 Tax=Paractinoplanes ferrugineus TaxID=113564 RepID=UPI0019429A94|nr:hypothetical protein [Actinoplanes ferrugineus]
MLLSGLAMGAVLGAPIAAAAGAGAEEVSTAAVEHVVAADGSASADGAAAAIREQFRSSFAAGAVLAPDSESTMVICDPS